MSLSGYATRNADGVVTLANAWALSKRYGRPLLARSQRELYFCDFRRVWTLNFRVRELDGVAAPFSLGAAGSASK
jgi:hypothetical protein